jgi:hypothetical protein
MSQPRMVRVSHPDLEATATKPAVVPASALARMTAQGWVEVTDEQPASEPDATDSVPDPEAVPVPDSEPEPEPTAEQLDPHETPAIKAAKKPGQRATTNPKEH